MEAHKSSSAVSSVALTLGFFLQTYAHVLKNDDREAAEQAAAFLIRDSYEVQSLGMSPDDAGCLAAMRGRTAVSAWGSATRVAGAASSSL